MKTVQCTVSATLNENLIVATYRVPLFFVHNGFYKLPRTLIPKKLVLFASGLHFPEVWGGRLFLKCMQK